MPYSFSQRHGFAGPPPGTLLHNEVPLRFRRFLAEDLVNSNILSQVELQKVVLDVLQVWPDPGTAPYYDVHRRVRECEWFQIYDIIEGLHRLLTKTGRVRAQIAYI